MRTGDFSELLDPNIMGGLGTIQLYDTANGFTPYQDNQIPITNSVVTYLVAHPEYYPLPNTAVSSRQLIPRPTTIAAIRAT